MKNRFKNLLCKIRNKIFIREIFLLKQLEKEDFDNYHTTTDCIFSELTVEDIECLHEKYKEELSTKKVNILKNRICDSYYMVYKAIMNGEIVGYFSVGFCDTFESGLKEFVKVDCYSAYLFDDYVFQIARGNGIHYKSILHRCKMAELMRKKQAIVGVYSNNKSSLTNYMDAGFTYSYKKTRIKIRDTMREVFNRHA